MLVVSETFYLLRPNCCVNILFEIYLPRNFNLIAMRKSIVLLLSLLQKVVFLNFLVAGNTNSSS